MPWGLWDDLVVIHAKWFGLSNDATATAFRAAQWARGPGARARPGFITEKQLRACSGGISARKFKAVVDDLLTAGLPSHERGIIVRVDGGFEFPNIDRDGRLIHDNVSAEPPERPERPKTGRAAAGRLGGLRSAEARRALSGTAQPRSNAPKQPEAKPRSNPEANYPVLRVASAEAQEPCFEAPSGIPEPKPNQPAAAASRPDSGSLEANPAASAAAASDASTEEPEPDREPANLEEALALPIFARAAILAGPGREQAHSHKATWLQPHEWPEVKRVNAELYGAMKRPEPPLLAYSRDAGVRAVVALYAAGWTPGDLVSVARHLPTTEYWQQKPRGLSDLTPGVCNRAMQRIPGATPLAPHIQRLVDQVRARKPPESDGD